ncbi:MAG: hypothetical protein ABI782_00895 [Anaerolineaceae bacterium]
MTNHVWRRCALSASLLVVIALGFAGCGGDDDHAGQNSSVVNAIAYIDSAGLHDIDESINLNNKIPATARTTVLHMQTAVLLAEWPSELDAPAKKLAALLGDLALVLNADTPDLAKVGPSSTAAHAAWHDFSQAVWSHLQAEAGLGGPATDAHGH